MGDLVNLRLHRKRKARAARLEQAAENRVKFGRTRAEKAQDRTEAARQARRLAGHFLEKPPETADQS